MFRVCARMPVHASRAPAGSSRQVVARQHRPCPSSQGNGCAFHITRGPFQSRAQHAGQGLAPDQYARHQANRATKPNRVQRDGWERINGQAPSMLLLLS